MKNLLIIFCLLLGAFYSPVVGQTLAVTTFERPDSIVKPVNTVAEICAGTTLTTNVYIDTQKQAWEVYRDTMGRYFYPVLIRNKWHRNYIIF